MKTPTQIQEAEHELHDHYAGNALVCGHDPSCAKVVDRVNWPTIMGTGRCSCGRGERWETRP